MAGRVDASRDLRLGLYALESGAIDQEQLVSAVRAWARSSGRTLSEILAARGVLDASALARLEDRVARDLPPPGGGLEPGPAAGAPTPDRPDGAGGFAPTATVAYAGRPPSGDADADR